MPTKIENYSVLGNSIEFYGKDGTVSVLAELDGDGKEWTITNCETDTSKSVPASEDIVSDASGIVGAVLGKANG